MTKHFLSGTGVAIVTPFLENGDIDTAALEKLINHLIDGGVLILTIELSLLQGLVVMTRNQ
jgi:dihydrodipicolinate synthase/N-acetylneuraminate lyase